MAIAQKVAGYSLGKADLLRRAMGKKKKSVLDAEYVGFEAGMKEQRLLRRGGQDALGHPGPVRRLRVQQGALGGLRADLLLDGVPQGQLPGRVHGRPAHQRRRRQGPPADLPGRVPPDGHQGAAAGRQRVVLGLHRRRHRHPLRPGLGAQRRAQRRRLDRPGPRGEGRRSRTSPTSCARSTRSPATRRSSSPWPRPGRSTPWATRGRASPRSTPRPSTRPWRSSARRPRGSSTCSAASATTAAADDPFSGALDIVIPTADWSKSERLVFERDMLGLYVSDHPLHGVEHVLTSHADTPIAEINAGGVEDGANVTIAGILTAVSPRTNKQGAPWAIATLEDLESGHRGAVLPQDLGGGLGEGRPRPDRRGEGPDQPARRPARRCSAPR